MKNTIIRYGTYGFVLAIVVFAICVNVWTDLDLAAHERIGYFMAVVSLSFVFFGIKHYRDKEYNGSIGLRRAVLIGLLISVIIGVGIAIANLIYTTFINPEFFDQYVAAMRKEGYRGEIPNYGRGFLAMIMFIMVMMLGIFFSVFSAAVLQRKRQ